ncbi:hypothetical protein pdam_00001085 [Pocillopora damicornis]|uniref:Uncharacterized protein n=1 Tax=Pocillopora damicornis TaxID=46731 RepID=A0A3M6V238_POCDA|nr:hypothetical protein pdam_00001085 [Pocillopora damicornis]
MAQRNVEWYSVHTNSVVLREMAQRNAEWYSVHTNGVALQFNFNGSLNIGGVREKSDFVCALDAMCQEAVRRETTEGSSIEFIGYRMLHHEQNGCTVSFTRHQ